MRIVLEGARCLGLRPEECCVVGDSQYDIEAGRDAGATTIVVCRERKKREQLRRFKPDYIVDNLLEIRRILEGSSAYAGGHGLGHGGMSNSG